jgi:hypothetical protein
MEERGSRGESWPVFRKAEVKVLGQKLNGLWISEAKAPSRETLSGYDGFW